MRVSVLPTVRSLAGAIALTLAAAAAAGAQTIAPSALQTDASAPPPTYAAPATGETISGSITAVTGKYTLQLRDSRGFIDNVTLHQGTIINPLGLTLAAGMRVTITGTNAGSSFAANQIDAPYTVALVPAYGYGYGPGYGAFGFGYHGWGWGGRARFGW